MYQVFPYTILEVDTLHIAVTIVIATTQMEQKTKGQVLAVDFEKRELKDTQHKSENDKQSFYINKTKICNDAVTIFQTAKSGGIWHMRAYIADDGKYHQKSLRTKDKASAIEKATYEHARLPVLKAEGKAIFSPTVGRKKS